jgi:CO/xanthine dehydrogenase FAD-binding subunit
MLLPKFEYHEPSTLEEACRVMADLGRKARPLAGGTDLMVNMKRKIISPEHVVCLSKIEELKKMDASDGRFRIGACLTAAELAESPQLCKALSALAMGASVLGSPLIRNLATIAGNIVTARPAADLPPPLLAYGAEVVLKKQGGERSVPLDDFFLGPGQTVIAPDEVLSEVVIDNPPPYSGAGYIKLGVRKTLEISLVNVAAFLTLDGLGGVIEQARIVLGAVAPTPIRALSAEQALVGERPSEDAFARAGTAAAHDSKPIDDFRGSAEYRRDMVEVLTRRALNLAYKEANR